MNGSTEIFTDSWKFAELPSINNGKSDIDYAHMVTIGSCFARNLNRWLRFTGHLHKEMPWGILYNPFSIQKEFERLFNNCDWEQHTLTEVANNHKLRYRDPWRSWHLADKKNDLKCLNEKFDVIAKTIVKDARDFLFTLGLTEIWSPANDRSIILNQVPIGSIRLGNKQWCSRFASVEDVYFSLEKTVNTIRKNITKTGHIIFTLSPVPLKYTASDLSIREANNLSKSTLLVAIRELVDNRSDVDYYPSYELVQALSEKQNHRVWQADGRHITAEGIDLVCTSFTKLYGGTYKPVSTKMFWVPRVDEEGYIVGKLYVNGAAE